MSLVATEHVLVVPTAVFHRLGHFQGFCGEVDRYLKGLLDPVRGARCAEFLALTRHTQAHPV